MPSGFQITQKNEPLAREGFVDVHHNNGTQQRIAITQIQIEQDSGKLVHDVAIRFAFAFAFACACVEIVLRLYADRSRRFVDRFESRECSVG